MKNGIIIGVSIIIAGVIIAMRLPRYQYVAYTTTVPYNDGTHTEETVSIVYDMVSGESYARSFQCNISSDRNIISTWSSVLHDPHHTQLEKWKKQFEVFGSKVLVGDEWMNWMKEHNW